MKNRGRDCLRWDDKEVPIRAHLRVVSESANESLCLKRSRGETISKIKQLSFEGFQNVSESLDGLLDDVSPRSSAHFAGNPKTPVILSFSQL